MYSVMQSEDLVHLADSDELILWDSVLLLSTWNTVCNTRLKSSQSKHKQQRKNTLRKILLWFQHLPVRVVPSMPCADTSVQVLSRSLTHVISYLGCSCHRWICRWTNKFFCIFSWMEWTENDLQPRCDAEELVMMKGRAKEITTLLIKDNGPPEMGTDISHCTLFWSMYCIRDRN